MQEANFITIISPASKNLNFDQKFTGRKVLHTCNIIIRNDNKEVYHFIQKRIAFKVQANYKHIQCNPPVGFLKEGEKKSIKLCFDDDEIDRMQIKIKLKSMTIDSIEEITNKYDILDRFKIAEQKEYKFHTVIFTEADPNQSIANVYDINFGQDQNSYLSSGESKRPDDSPFNRTYVSQKLMKISNYPNKGLKYSIIQEQEIRRLQDTQDELIEQTRDLAKQIVIFKAQRGIPQDSKEDTGIKFNIFQVFIIMILFFILGYYVPEY